MYKNKNILGFIPARGGSKGIPMKNIKLLRGKPLITYTFHQVSQSNVLDKVVVSTDDEQISNISLSHEINVIKRPAEISGDTASTESAVIHSLDILLSQGQTFDYVAILEPTSPFRTVLTIDESVKSLIDSPCESLLTVRPSTSNIGSLSDSCFVPFNPLAPRRRQDRTPHFIETSTLYCASVPYLYKNKSLVSKKWLAYIVSEEESIDINTNLDFSFAEFMLETFHA